MLNSGDLLTCCGSFMESTTTYGQGMGKLNLSREAARARVQGLGGADRDTAATA